MNPENIRIPSTADSERAVIAAILDNGDGYADAAEIVSAQDFTVKEYQTAWSWMSDLFASSRPVNLISMSQSFSQTPDWRGVRDALACEQSSGAAVKHLAATLSDRAALRRAVAALMRACEGASKANTFHEVRPSLEALLMGVFADTGKRDIIPISKAVQEIQDLMANPGSAVRQFRTGFPSLDAMTKGGPREKHLVVIAGKSGEGKTSLAMNLLANMANDGVRCGVFSLEMDAHELTRRAIFSAARGESDEAFMRACEEVSGMQIHIADNPDRTVESIRAAIRLMVMRYQVQVVAVDYLQLIGAAPQKGETRERQVANMSRQLKIAAKESGVLVIALSQLNEEGQLRESRAIEQDADGVVYVYKPDGDNGHYLWLTKNRHGAKHGNVSQMVECAESEGIPLYFDARNFRFTEIPKKI